MKFFSVNQFVETVMTIDPTAKEVLVAYLIRDAKEDKFGKVTAFPLYIIIKHENDVLKWTYDDILDNFEDSIGLTLGKETTSTNGVALCQISTEEKFSPKYGVNYHPRTYLTPGPNMIKEVNKIANKRKEASRAQTFDI